METQQLVKYLDLTLLTQDSTSKEIKTLAKSAVSYKTAGLCIQPNSIHVVKNILKDSGVLLIVVPNWIKGGGLLPGKDYILEWCKEVDEVDYIVNLYKAYESKEHNLVEDEIKKVKQYSKVLKVIIESNYVRTTHYDERIKLTKEIIKVAEGAGADWIKSDSSLFKRQEMKVKVSETSSIIESAFEGLIDDVKTVLKYAKVPVKVAGGIRHKREVEELIKLGVKRIGTSSVGVLDDDDDVVIPDKY